MVQLRELAVPVEGIRFQDSSLLAVVDTTDLGKGTLYVSESTLCWRNSASGEGFEMQYSNMCLHAISRDVNVHERPCIYIMVNGRFCSNESSPEGSDGEGDDDPDPEEKVTEIKLVPDNPDVLPTIYAAIQDCSLLHPDPSSDMSLSEGDEDEDGEEEEDEDIGGVGDHEDYDPEDDNEGRAPGLDGAGDHGNGHRSHPHPHQFADAEGDES